jgi:hypothetical protein
MQERKGPANSPGLFAPEPAFVARNRLLMQFGVFNSKTQMLLKRIEIVIAMEQ